MSYSALAAYLECPWCSQVQRRKRRPKEPERFNPLQQGTLFSSGNPDPRYVGTLLHTIVNLLHAQAGTLTKEQQQILLTDSERLVRFLRGYLLTVLQLEGKNALAMFLNGLSANADMLHTHVISPMLRYQQGLKTTRSVVFAASERFQYKLLSTRNTFPAYPDRGGYVGLVGEFDQIRVRHDPARGTVPAIIEFKKGLGAKKPEENMQGTLFAELAQDMPTQEPQPTVYHAMQLLVYWLAFQTRWDISAKFKQQRGMVQELPMPLEQELELIIYNLNDGRQYQLQPTDLATALSALIECIFYLDWCMKSHYAWRSPEHGCRRPQLTEVPEHVIQVQVGSDFLTGKECYQLARDAFERFKNTVRWERYRA